MLPLPIASDSGSKCAASYTLDARRLTHSSSNEPSFLSLLCGAFVAFVAQVNRQSGATKWGGAIALHCSRSFSNARPASKNGANRVAIARRGLCLDSHRVHGANSTSIFCESPDFTGLWTNCG